LADDVADEEEDRCLVIAPHRQSQSVDGEREREREMRKESRRRWDHHDDEMNEQ
jgi:hypothetical protein